MATVLGNDDVIAEAGEVEEERGAAGTSPLPSVDNNEIKNQEQPPAYPGNSGEGDWGHEMSVMGKPAPVVTEPEVNFIATDETSTASPITYTLSLSTSVALVYSTFAQEAGYIEGTFRLVWKKESRSGTTEEEEELFQNSTAALYEMGMEGGKEYLTIRCKDDRQPERSDASTPGTNLTSTTLNNAQANTAGGGGNYGNSSNYSNYSNNYGYSNYGYQSYNSKSETGFVGLVNQAMTCYLNSLLQTLYMTPEFRNALYKWRFTRSNGDDDGTKSIPYQLQRLFIHLQTSDKRAVETTDVTKSFGWDSSEAWQQHDVQELCRVMFDALERRFKKDKYDGADLINHLYQGTLKDYVKCLQCHCESAREDHFLDIPLVIKPFGSTTAYGSVEEAMAAFVEPETLSGDNQYMCEQCQMKCDAHKGLKFKSFPYLLTLQLKRFDFDYSTMHRIKLNERMSFPRILDLNHFILEQDMPPVPPDVEERYRDFVVEEFAPQPPPYHYSHSNNSYSYSNAVSSYTVNRYPEASHKPSINVSHDTTNDHTVADSNNDVVDVANSNEDADKAGVEGAESADMACNDLTVGQRLKRGPYVYELFSIMIHSGSAIGGHYYAYIKCFADKRWYCFNDQSVTKLNEEDIEGTFGGPDSRSRGYYSSMYASSANAYMLMYRRIDQDTNKSFIPLNKLPEHVQEQIEEGRRREREKQLQEEFERSLCKFRLFARHPVSAETVEKRIEVRQQWTLQDTVVEAHRLMELQDLVPVSRCRLVRYDEYTECLDQSFEEDEGETFCQIVGGPKNYYSFELFLEIRGEDEVFKPYNRGGLNLKVLVVDVPSAEVAQPVSLRAEQSWSVLELKTEISHKFHLSVSTMRVALETYQSDGKLLSIDTNQLKTENIFRKHTVFVCSDADDYTKPYRESEMCRLIDSHVNSILLIITIPPPPQTRPDIPMSESEHQESHREGEGEGGGEGETVGEGGSEREGEREGKRGRDGDREREEGSSVDRQEPARTVTPDGADVTSTPDKGPPSLEEESRNHPDTQTPSGGENPAPTEPQVDMTKERPLQRTINLRIDKRCTLQDLKDRLVEYVKQPSTNFKIYRLYSNNQEYEMFRVTDQLSTVPNETRMLVRLGRALQPGEVRVRLSLLRMGEVEFFKPLMDSIITRGMTVRDFKNQFIQEAYNQGIEHPFEIDKLRLRKKTWRTASTIYLDNQVFEKDIHIFANVEIYVEPLPGPEPMTRPNQLQVYLRRWRPSEYTIGTPHEIILDENSPAHLKQRISEASGIPEEQVMFAKAHTSFPCEVSVLDMEDDLDWNPNVTSIGSMPLSIYDDGAVVYYKDAKEKAMELTAEKRSEIQKNERVKSTTHTSSHSSYQRYHGKEKALKIYTAEDDDDKPVDEK